MGDLWGGNARVDIAAHLRSRVDDQPRLVLAHQPDTAALMSEGSASLIVSGHTHGRQIWLPWITEHWVLPGMSTHGWWNGRYDVAAGPIFVTAGMGTVGLPARLGVAPRADVLTLERAGP